ncbi:hypothetical protein TNCV_2122591 [Trichonephila clavipes]|nr:hypothetical protein TNCV_2122591 [Trichonephila clavipes]
MTTLTPGLDLLKISWRKGDRRYLTALGSPEVPCEFYLPVKWTVVCRSKGPPVQRAASPMMDCFIFFPNYVRIGK